MVIRGKIFTRCSAFPFLRCCAYRLAQPALQKNTTIIHTFVLKYLSEATSKVKIMKEIKLVCDTPFFDKVDVNVLDFPSGHEGEPRRRCKITLD